MLAAVLAYLSFVPFEWVAKGTLLVCAFLFVVDPFPPTSRLVALISLVLVAVLTRLYNEHRVKEDDITFVENNENVDRSEASKTTGSDTAGSSSKKTD